MSPASVVPAVATSRAGPPSAASTARTRSGSSTPPGVSTTTGAGIPSSQAHDHRRQLWFDRSASGACDEQAVVESVRRVYCADAFGRLVERDLADGRVTRRLDSQNGAVGSLWPAHDGRELHLGDMMWVNRTTGAVMKHGDKFE